MLCVIAGDWAAKCSMFGRLKPMVQCPEKGSIKKIQTKSRENKVYLSCVHTYPRCKGHNIKIAQDVSLATIISLTKAETFVKPHFLDSYKK